jgi:hypothetical protein
MAEKQWRMAIEKALRGKGFTKKGARKTAIRTMRMSAAKQKLVASRRDNWREVNDPDRSKYRTAGQEAKRLHDDAAINKPSNLAGKIVVIPPRAADK